MTVRIAETTHVPHVTTFVRHYVEMVVAMALGMGLLHPVWMLATHGAADDAAVRSTEVMVLVMATSMALPMAAWMWHHKHGWAAVARMSALMYLGLALPMPLLWADLTSRGGVLAAGHVLMLVLMLAEMLAHGEEYAGHHR
jgi:hypothetical protein